MADVSSTPTIATSAVAADTLGRYSRVALLSLKVVGPRHARVLHGMILSQALHNCHNMPAAAVVDSVTQCPQQLLIGLSLCCNVTSSDLGMSGYSTVMSQGPHNS